MHKKVRGYLLLGAAALAFAGLWFAVSPGYGQEAIPGDVLRGGQLYQAWDRVLEIELPERNQPIWTEIAPDEEYDPRSWRCVTCHGWDYRGSEGWAPRAVVNRAGIPGLFSMVAEGEEVILPWLDGENNPGHNFSNYLSEEDMLDLSAFLSSGLIAPELIANLETQLVPGTVSTGEVVYTDYCFACHGVDGAKINFGGAANPLYLADVALQNPWRVAHVIRFGHIGDSMPAADVVELGLSQQLDLLAYAQTLPQAKIIGSPEFQVIEYDSQANTVMLAAASIALVLVILGGAVWVTKRKP
jgi:thiosulfate dehydrogenase